jgi:hypothetical protein
MWKKVAQLEVMQEHVNTNLCCHSKGGGIGFCGVDPFVKGGSPMGRETKPLTLKGKTRFNAVPLALTLSQLFAIIAQRTRSQNGISTPPLFRHRKGTS